MNKEMILGITGLSMTLVVLFLAVSFFSNDPEQSGSTNLNANSGAQLADAGAPVAKAQMMGSQEKEVKNELQNCFMGFITAMCKLLPGEISSLFNETVICPPNFPRSG